MNYSLINQKFSPVLQESNDCWNGISSVIGDERITHNVSPGVRFNVSITDILFHRVSLLEALFIYPGKSFEPAYNPIIPLPPNFPYAFTYADNLTMSPDLTLKTGE